MRWLVLIFAMLIVTTGCEASFEDLRPAGAQNDSNNIDPLVDPLADMAGEMDMGVAETDQGVDEDAGDVGGEDLGAPIDMNDSGEETLFAQGNFQNGSDYDGEGTVSIYKLTDGSWELRLGDDFRVGGVPGPVVVLSLEPNLGPSLDSQRGDVELGVLESNSGASTFALPFAPGQRRYAWIYCKPFGLQVIRAELMDVN